MKSFYPNVWLFFLLVYSIPGQTTPPALILLHSNNTNGALENCYCPDHPLGSIEKRSAFLETYRQEHDNTILVDAGDFFSPAPRPFKDSLLCVGYGLMNYDAVLPGDQELSRDYFSDYIPLLKAPIVVTNLKKPHLPGVMPYVLVNRAGRRVAILGVIDPEAFKYYPEEIRQSVHLRDPVQAVKATLREIYPLPDLIILLSHSGYDRDRELARKLPEVDVIVGGHSQTAVKSPSLVGSVLVVQAGKEGYYTGVVELNQTKQGSLVPMTLDMPDDPRILNLISLYEEKTGFVNKRKLKLRNP
ncbi:MAG: hypothetical protein D6762_04985 [Candidatus Neomarinimicrobiota bacterium]|nr:MAG: hypothetical protein D6762_04985 [Candidatus Neomarinimicrobiota bacterium]